MLPRVQKRGGAFTLPICSVEGCGRKSRARTFCTKHYQRWQSHGDPLAGKYQAPPQERFWRYVDRGGPNGCWSWIGAKCRKTGYGSLQIDGTGRRAHRFSYELHHGPIPDGMVVMHACDNPGCVNPAHLSLGTNQDNVDDKMAKGRHRGPRGELSGSARLTRADVVRIRAERRTCNVWAAELGVSPKTIADARSGRTWAHLGQD